MIRGLSSTLQNPFVFDWSSREDADISKWVVAKGGAPEAGLDVHTGPALRLPNQKKLVLNEALAALATNQHCNCFSGKGRGAVERGIGFNSSCGSAT